MSRRRPSKLDAALQSFVTFELTARDSAEQLRAIDVTPCTGDGADLLRAEVSQQVWHSAVRILSMALGGREFTR